MIFITVNDFFARHGKCAVAFSGGTDSSYLLYAAKSCGAAVHAYYVNTAFQPTFELEDAIEVAQQLDVLLSVVELDIFAHADVIKNSPERCYYCKKEIMSAIISVARADGYNILIDGTNASDDLDDRPGSRALRELNILSPLRECGISKTEVIRLSKEAGLFTADKAAYACLATRIRTGVAIDKESLVKVEKSEDYLRESGFYDFRVRIFDGAALIQLRCEQFETAIVLREKIKAELSQYFKEIFLDLNSRE